MHLCSYNNMHCIGHSSAIIFFVGIIFSNFYANINFVAGQNLHYRESIESIGGDFYP